MTQLVIFDMDGVLVDSEPHYRKVNGRIFQELGIAMTPTEHDGYVGLSAEGMWTNIKAKHGLKQSVEALVQNEKTQQYANFETTDLAPIPGVKPLIESLKAQGVKLAVGSSSALNIIELLTTKTGLRQLFDHVQSGESVPNGKPAPDLFLSIATHFEVLPSECWVIEDSHNGLKAAHNAGMRCVGYQNPHSGQQDLSRAEGVVSNFECNLEALLSRLLG